MQFHVPILTYHSQNIAGHATADNDHVAFAADLEQLHGDGWRFISLDTLLDCLDGSGVAPGKSLCLTFDDGCDFDARDIDYPGFGVQRSFLGIMRDFVARHGPSEQPGLQATSFVIASGEARGIIDQKSLFGKGWISDDWWGEDPLIGIGNHGWDHNHPDLGPERGGFSGISTMAQCERQVEEAATEIEQRCGTRPAFFAYPFGESSEFIREHYFPKFTHRHRCRAALGTEPGHVTAESNRWNLPRYVCGRDWKSPHELLSLVGD
ncbi:MAG: polysaccharide deacetylase family protein [Xanthomonadales bacterium]|nr:polysaccharide deacetylase family protein [Gammaproteobacteria bacterium]NNE04683.1 polysaccharide deacetylase family protein [Xanthomonadales bacterium]NNL95901.1 polysaccharide deacetylase family protein [Xanthomonadales bacterium]